jgi:hypothetical protein
MTSAVAELLRGPITFQAADGTTVHSPLIEAGVNGVDALFVLDTGSDVHLLTTETAERAGLRLEPGEEGTDHAGTSMPSWPAGDVELTFTGLTLTLRDVVIPAPPPFPSRGIGGILSPQHLDARARIMIDLVGDELTFVDGTPDEVTAWLAARSPELTTLVLERDGTTATPVVAGAIDPFPETAVMLNTGGRGTEFDETVVPDLAVGEQERHPPALVGMEVLRGTVFALDSDPGGVVTWQLGGTT